MIYDMKAVLIVLLAGGFVLSPCSGKTKSGSSSGQVHVKEHTTKNGKTVQAHDRTRANKDVNDNWSTQGNTNPDTGKKGTKQRK
jgi:hypothetical protein